MSELDRGSTTSSCCLDPVDVGVELDEAEAEQGFFILVG